jgi:hypothetical protein
MTLHSQSSIPYFEPPPVPISREPSSEDIVGTSQPEFAHSHVVEFSMGAPEEQPTPTDSVISELVLLRHHNSSLIAKVTELETSRDDLLRIVSEQRDLLVSTERELADIRARLDAQAQREAASMAAESSPQPQVNSQSVTLRLPNGDQQNLRLIFNVALNFHVAS